MTSTVEVALSQVAARHQAAVASLAAAVVLLHTGFHGVVEAVASELTYTPSADT